MVFTTSYLSSQTKIHRDAAYNYRNCRMQILINEEIKRYNLYNNKYMIDSTQITNTEIFAIIAVLVFNLLSRNLRKFKKITNFKL